VFGGAEEVLVHDGDAFGVRDAVYFREVDLLHDKNKLSESGVDDGPVAGIEFGLGDAFVSSVFGVG